MTRRGEVLVAIINNLLDLETVRSQHWYRIPISSQEKWLKDRWPPDIVAFYLTKKFGLEAFEVNYFAQVIEIHEKVRLDYGNSKIITGLPLGRLRGINLRRFSGLALGSSRPFLTKATSWRISSSVRSIGVARTGSRRSNTGSMGPVGPARSGWRFWLAGV
jgi:hypothetical protein